MAGLYIAIAVTTSIVVIELVIWAMVAKPPWDAIRRTALFAAYGIGATAAFFVFAAWVRNTPASALTLLGLCLVSYFVAEALDQI